MRFAMEVAGPASRGPATRSGDLRRLHPHLGAREDQSPGAWEPAGRVDGVGGRRRLAEDGHDRAGPILRIGRIRPDRCRRHRDPRALDFADRRIAGRIARLGRVVRAAELAEAALAIEARWAASWDGLRAVGGMADAGEAGAAR